MQKEELSHTFTGEASTSRLNQWLFDTIQPYIRGRTMELGSRHGAIASIFVEHELPIHLSDELKENRLNLANRFKDVSYIRMIHDMDFFREDFENAYETSVGAFSTVIAINIAEHGYYDERVLNNATYLLGTRGHFILIAPAYTALFYGLNDDLVEWKKQNAVIVKKLMRENVDVLKVRCFDWSEPGTDNQRYGLSTLAILRKKDSSLI